MKTIKIGIILNGDINYHLGFSCILGSDIAGVSSERGI
jgi:hypothetical protein